MLVLSRKLDERVVLTLNGVQVEIAVVRIGSNSVRIGVDAPVEVKVLRGELVGSKLNEVA